MQPTILCGDVVFINKLAYDLRVPFTTVRLARWAEPARGDVVVCFAPDDNTRLVPADRWLTDSTTLELAGMRFEVERVGPSHTPEDLTVFVPSEKLLFAGDLFFNGRLPFVGKANSSQWIL
eukprot:gene3085-3839_t